jgi:transcription initiation factor IIE alpha subunit
MTYEVAVDETEKNEPVYCPFCGSDIDIDEEEDFIQDIDDEYDELDFDDYRD